MAVGQSSLQSYNSYVAIGRETVFGTYNTATAALPFLASGIVVTQEHKMLEQVETARTYSNGIRMAKVVEGDIEVYAYAESLAFNYLLQHALGGTVTSATATGETAGGAAFTHTYLLGNLDSVLTYTSLCINTRKGDSAAAMCFQYSGVRVNTFGLNAALDDALRCTFGVICKDGTKGSNDVSSVLSTSAHEPLNFVNGRVSVESTFASLTTSSYWHVQGVEFSLENNLKADAESRRIGTDTLDILPAGIANFTLNLTLRFDTVTAYDAMLANSEFACELDFLGTTLATSAIRRGVKLQMPRIRISNAGDPQIGGPDEVLTSQVVCHVLRDIGSAGGFALKALVTNATSSYA